MTESGIVYLTSTFILIICFIRWLPLFILVLYFFLFNIGLSSYVWIITAEILPFDVRYQIIPVAVFLSSSLWFLVTFSFRTVFLTFGGTYIFLFYGSTSLFFACLSFLYLPDTAGKSDEEIRCFFKELTVFGTFIHSWNYLVLENLDTFL